MGSTILTVSICMKNSIRIHTRIQKVLSERVQHWKRVFWYFIWWGERGSAYHNKQAIIGPPATKCHLNGILLACPWWPNIEFWLSSFVIFQWIRSNILLRKPYILVIYQGGSRPHVPPPSLDPGMEYKGWTISKNNHLSIFCLVATSFSCYYYFRCDISLLILCFHTSLLSQTQIGGIIIINKYLFITKKNALSFLSYHK